MPERLHIRRLDNGLTVIGQDLDNVTSAAVSAVFPCGAFYDPGGSEGSAAVAGEWIMRGAADRDTRELNDALDSLGCRHHVSIGSRYLRFSSVQLDRNLPDMLDIFADIVRRPRLDEESFEHCRMLITQDIEALEDEPSRKARLILRERFFPYPMGRITLGTAESVADLSAAGVRQHLLSHLLPSGAIIGAAGNFDFDRLVGQVERLFGDWEGGPPAEPAVEDPRCGASHVDKDSAQTYIATAHRAPVLSDEDNYYPARVVEAILSHGMGSRLFVEVREKRGLAYHVSAGYFGLREAAGLFTFAGTRPETARETLEIMTDQLRGAGEDISDDELERAKTQIRSSLVMEGQSSTSRAGAIVADWYILQKIRGLDEISGRIDRVDRDTIGNYLAEYPLRGLSLVTVGPEPVEYDSRDT